ncbi:MAG: Brp/Blh family beta-carotene 15,15'-dioxygenase [Planctomycetota bacterium]
MHLTGVVVACLTVATASVIGISFPPGWVSISLAIGVATIGIPHGGLDHWTGRRLLESRFGRAWPLVFFPGYLAVALLIATGWFYAPLATALLFFLISAWHFGVEDDRSISHYEWINHVASIAMGGLVIWIPMLFQSDEIRVTLRSIIPDQLSLSADRIVDVAQWMSLAFIPLAVVAIAVDFYSRRFNRFVRNSAFATLFCVADPLISFGIYFCLWHSVRGLNRLKTEHELTTLQLARAAAPLSLGAIGLALFGLCIWSPAQPLAAATYRTLFVSLSAMAVPHLVLHGPLAAAFPNWISPTSRLVNEERFA